MTRLIEATYTCAVCGKKVGVLGGIESTHPFGKPDLDMRPPGYSTFGLEYQTCRHCGYVSWDISSPVSDIVKNYVLSPEYQKKAAEEVPPDYRIIKRYRNMCDILLMDKKYSAGFHAIMKAAWAADDMSDNDCAVKLRKKALSILENTLVKDYLSADTVTLFRADLYRRIGDFDKVRELCSDYYTLNPLIADSLVYEKELAAQKDTAAHRVRYNREKNDENKFPKSANRECINKIEDEPKKPTEEKNTEKSLIISIPRDEDESLKEVTYFLSEREYKKGEKYFDGDGVKQNYKMALRFFIKAAKYGNEKALYKLGFFYELGIAVDLDEEKAIHWYRKSAELGYEEAHSALKDLGRRYYSIGKQYFEGDGVEQDYQTAIKYFHKAAELGDEEAQMAINSLEPKQTNNHGDAA